MARRPSRQSRSPWWNCRVKSALLVGLFILGSRGPGGRGWPWPGARLARGSSGAEAEALVSTLPGGSAHALLLRAELAFVRGDFTQAEELARVALTEATGPTRAGFLFRLAEIELYLGRFSDARGHARDGLEMARAAADRTPSHPRPRPSRSSHLARGRPVDRIPSARYRGSPASFPRPHEPAPARAATARTGHVVGRAAEQRCECRSRCQRRRYRQMPCNPTAGGIPASARQTPSPPASPPPDPGLAPRATARTHLPARDHAVAERSNPHAGPAAFAELV
jgi:hypothetical protein